MKLLPGEGEVTPQDLMTTVATNYGICRANAVAHQGLVEWIQRQAGVK